MSERFIKFIPSEEAMWLLKNRGHAFRLLTIIAESARREHGNGLNPSEAFIGGHENYDMTEQNYRSAKKILEERNHIKIIETCRTRKKHLITTENKNANTKVTTEVTTVSTKVKLISSNVYDININIDNDRSNERLTTEIKFGNDKQERQYKECKETTTPTPSSKEEAVVVFSCLQSLNDSSISENEKIALTKKHTHEEKVVIDAVAAITHPSFKPEGTMLKSLRAAIKGKWKCDKPIYQKSDIEANKKLAKKLENVSHAYSFIALNEHLEIILGTTGMVKTIMYHMTHEAFCAEIEKQGKINLKKSLEKVG